MPEITQRSAGLHEAVFEAGDLDSGFYLAKIVARGAVATREMLLLK